MNGEAGKRKIGLLMCDEVPVSRRHLEGGYYEMFSARFRRFAPSVTLVRYDVRGGVYPRSLDECDGYLSTGASESVFEDLPWVHRLREFVRQLYEEKKTFVGICFGHQMIADALGGECVRAPCGYIVGVRPVTITETRPWMEPPLTQCNLISSHRDQVVKLPPGGVVLARSPKCPYAMFAVGDHFVGIQAHPELSAPYYEVGLRARVERIGRERVEEGLKTLSLKTDEHVVMRWIANIFALRAGDGSAAFA